MAHLMLQLLLGVLMTRLTEASDSETINLLMKRMERLELHNSKQNLEIKTLNAKLEEVERNSLHREEALLNELNRVKAKCLDKVTASSSTASEEKQGENTKYIQQSLKEDRKNGIHQTRLRTARQAVETEVAFYATHTQHDVRHLGKNAIIEFDNVVSNIGNAYHSSQGTFVSPVDGVYVFHVTIMGQDTHNISNNHFSAYIDVNGVPYSVFWVVPHDQSSQMFVTELKKGSIVSVKNRFEDDGIVGQHMSSFSGFLLYQHISTSEIVGK